jgi:hypothetical protein
MSTAQRAAQAAPQPKIVIDPGEMRSMISEGFHTAFRKCDGDSAWAIWKLIDKMPPQEWSAVIDFVMSGFEGYAVPPLPRPVPPEDAGGLSG